MVYNGRNMTKKRTFIVGVNDINDRLLITVKDIFEIDPVLLDSFKKEYFDLIDKYDNSIL